MNLDEIIEGVGFETMTSWIESFAEKIENEGKNEILLLNIDEEDLKNQNPNNIYEIGSVKYGDWESLKKYIPENDVYEEIEESKAFFSEIKEELEEEGYDFEDYDFLFHRVLLLCNKQYVHSMTLYTKF